MSPIRIAIVIGAAVLAIVLAVVVKTMVAPTKPAVAAATPHVVEQPAPPMTRVLAAKAELAVGTRLSPENMTWQAWPAATLNPAYITDGAAPAPKATGVNGVVVKAATTVGDMTSGGGPAMQAMVGAIVKDTIYAGEPITAGKIVRGADSGYMAVRLPPGMRAMSVPINTETGAGGFIAPGDRVDILSSHQDQSKGGQGFVTETVMTNVKVLAVDQKTEAPVGSNSIIGAVVTLEVPAASAEALARAKAQGGLTMALRSYADIGGGTGGAASSTAGHSIRVFKGGAPAEVVVTQ